MGELFYHGLGFVLILIGLYGILTLKNVFRLILALGIMETGVNIILVATGWHTGAKVPIIDTTVQGAGFAAYADPLPSALVLTAIVIGLGTTALALVLALLYKESHGTDELAEETEEEVVE